MEGHAVEKKQILINTNPSSFAAIMLVVQKRIYILGQEFG
jgi:hypothetical protein